MLGIVIKSFNCAATESIFRGVRSGTFQCDIERRSRRKLRMLAASAALNDLRAPPGNHLEKLKGDRAGHHGIRINDRWRVCFKWRSCAAHGVEIVDYH